MNPNRPFHSCAEGNYPGIDIRTAIAAQILAGMCANRDRPHIEACVEDAVNATDLLLTKLTEKK